MFKNEEGFSLLELVVAVGVAGIIAAVALPTFAGLQDKATTTSATYAASASAAEALANSTIGGVNGTTSNNSSYIGGASSSSSTVNTAPASLGYNFVDTDLGGGGSCNVYNFGGATNTIKMYCGPLQSTLDAIALLTPGNAIHLTVPTGPGVTATVTATFVSWDAATKTITVTGLESESGNVFLSMSF